MQTARLPLTFACFSLDLALCGFGWGAGDAPTYRALDKEDESRWYPRSLKELFNLISEAEHHIFLQLRFDGAYRREYRRAAIGIAIEFVNEITSSRPLHVVTRMKQNSQLPPALSRGAQNRMRRSFQPHPFDSVRVAIRMSCWELFPQPTRSCA